MPNTHIVCMLHQFLNKICVLCFVGIMERKDFERLPFFWRWQPILAGAFSLATDGPEEIIYRLINMAKLQDLTIILVFSHFIISSYIFFFLSKLHF